jgi:ArsR family transcriptional regulator
MIVVMNDIVAFSRALADPTRWRIVRLVMEDALCVCELADILEMPQSSVSSHVQIIRKTGLLESEKCGKWAYFQIHRDFRELIGTLAEFFADSADATFASDTARSIQRLARREYSCCPGPKTLAVRTLLK